MKCSRCKAPLQKGTRFCIKCGAKVKHTGRQVIAVIFAFAILVGGAGFAGWKLGLLSFGNSDAEAVLSAELNQLLSNNGGIHFISETGDPISSLQGGESQEKIMSCISYTLEQKSADNNTVVIDAEFAYPDLISLAENYIMEGNDPDNFAKWINEHIEDEALYLNASVSFTMRKNNGDWEITLPSEIYEILSGGMQSYMRENNAQIYTGLKGDATS